MGTEKEWEKPKLIALARGKPEEAVLGYCKQSGYSNIGAGWGCCAGWQGPGVGCAACDSCGPIGS